MAASGISVPDLGPTFGALYLGSIVSATLFGFTSNQAYVYFKTYHNEDAMSTQLLILILWVLDAIQVSLMVHMSWTYVVIGYADPSALSVLVWSFSLELGLTVSVTFMVRSFYMKQLWGLSNRNYIILGPALFFAVGQLALGLQTSVHMFQAPGIATVTTKLFQWILGSKCVSSVIADVIITLATCYYLHAARTGFTKTNELINLLSVYTINRGVLAMLLETVVMITFLTMKTNFIFAALHLMLGKLHTASLFALLNHRDTLRVRQSPEQTMLAPLDLPRTSGHPDSRAHGAGSRRNVEVMVTSETVVDTLYNSEDQYSSKKENKERYPYTDGPTVW